MSVTSLDDDAATDITYMVDIVDGCRYFGPCVSYRRYDPTRSHSTQVGSSLLLCVTEILEFVDEISQVGDE